MDTLGFKKKLSTKAAASEFKDRDDQGFFVISGETPEFSAPDPNLSREAQIEQALEIFERSFEKKSNEPAVKYVVVYPKL